MLLWFPLWSHDNMECNEPACFYSYFRLFLQNINLCTSMSINVNTFSAFKFEQMFCRLLAYSCNGVLLFFLAIFKWREWMLPDSCLNDKNHHASVQLKRVCVIIFPYLFSWSLYEQTMLNDMPCIGQQSLLAYSEWLYTSTVCLERSLTHS